MTELRKCDYCQKEYTVDKVRYHRQWSKQEADDLYRSDQIINLVDEEEEKENPDQEKIDKLLKERKEIDKRIAKAKNKDDNLPAASKKTICWFCSTKRGVPWH